MYISDLFEFVSSVSKNKWLTSLIQIYLNFMLVVNLKLINQEWKINLVIPILNLDLKSPFILRFPRHIILIKPNKLVLFSLVFALENFYRDAIIININNNLFIIFFLIQPFGLIKDPFILLNHILSMFLWKIFINIIPVS